ncbi:MAG: DNA primase small subunit domain-containing protein [Candidatus Woesearchaeota archaeon]
MFLAKTLQFYKRAEVRTAILKQAKDKEIAVRFQDFFGKRPDALFYEADILELAKKKATSFHCSEELWTNPLAISSDMKPTELEELRCGWDLILDIDCHHFLYSKAAAHILVKILQDHEIESVTCKFSGNKGFHLAVPFESFPETINGQEIKKLFPDAPRRIAYYLRDLLKPRLEAAIMKLEKQDVNNVSKRTEIPVNKLIQIKEENGKEIRTLDVEAFLEIDTVLIAPRHLYRMPYSFHEKSELVSVPVKINEILKFKKEMAKPENVRFDIPFLNREVTRGEATKLIINAFDSHPKEPTRTQEKKHFEMPDEAVEEENFPPCIKLTLNGLEDGKKRMLFTLINFFKGVNWTFDAIDQKIHEWNTLNPEPLREVYLKGQLAQLRKQKDAIPPHNCKSYYEDLRVCKPDSFCSRIRNPLQYAVLKQKMKTEKEKPKGRPRLTEEQKEMRKRYREKVKKQEEKTN